MAGHRQSGRTTGCERMAALTWSIACEEPSVRNNEACRPRHSGFSNPASSHEANKSWEAIRTVNLSPRAA